MKRLLSVLCVICAFCLLLCGCGRGGNNSQTEEDLPLVTDTPHKDENTHNGIVPEIEQDIEDMMPDVDDGVIDGQGDAGNKGNGNSGNGNTGNGGSGNGSSDSQSPSQFPEVSPQA